MHHIRFPPRRSVQQTMQDLASCGTGSAPKWGLSWPVCSCLSSSVQSWAIIRISAVLGSLWVPSAFYRRCRGAPMGRTRWYGT